MSISVEALVDLLADAVDDYENAGTGSKGDAARRTEVLACAVTAIETHLLRRDVAELCEAIDRIKSQ